MKKNGISSHLLKMAFSSTLLFTSGAWATDFPVTSTGDGNVPGTLRHAINSYNAAPTGSDTITISLPTSSIITLTSNLPPLNAGIGKAVTIDATAAPGLLISGAASFQPFFVDTGNVSIVGNATTPMGIFNGRATGSPGGAGIGGGGGGGGSAGGGAIFVSIDAEVAISNCNLISNGAVAGAGGAGGTVAPANGGSGGGGAGCFGGGAGGVGGISLVGGGGGGGGYPGGGAGGAGGSPSGTAGGNNTIIGGGGGGGGTGNIGPAATGGLGFFVTNDGGQGGTTSSRESPGFGLGGGGGGGGHDGSIGTKVQPGGPFGGGGGGGGTDSTLIEGGDGGIGAGGGGGNSINSGNGGAGGVGGGGGGGGGTAGTGGASLFSGGTGGNGGIVGGNRAAGGGGGGSALGGAIFIHNQGTFTIGDNSSITGGSVIGGAGGAAPGGSSASPGTTGGALGVQIFMLQGGTLNYNSSTDMTLANPIQGDNGAAGGSGGGLFVNGPGSLTLSGANTYTSSTTVNGGTFKLGAGASLATPITFNGGTLDFSASGSTVTLNDLSGSASSTIILGGTDLAVNETQDTTFSGTITGTGAASLTINGNSTLTLAGTSNTYGGGTIIGGTATCAIADNGSLGASGAPITFGTAGTDVPTLEIGTTALEEGLASDVPLNRNLALNGTNNIVNTKSNNVTHSGTTSGSKPLQVRGRGATSPPIVTITKGWAHTGGTTLTRNASPGADDDVGPNLVLQGNMASLPTNGDLSLDTGTNFDMSDGTIPGGAQTLGNLNGAGNIQVGDNTLNVNLTADAQYDGNISDAATAFVGAGTGTLVVNGAGKRMVVTGNNSHSGGTKLKSVALAFCNDVNLGGTSVALQMGVAPADLPELQANCSQVTISRGANLVADKNVIGLAGNELVHQGSVATTGPGKLHITGTNPILDAPGGVYRVRAPMQHTGHTAVEGGTLLMDGPTATLPPGKDVELSSGTVLDISPENTANQSIGALKGLGRAQIDRHQITVNPTSNAAFDGPIQGIRGRVRKSGSNAWALSAPLTYDGGTTIDDGTLAIVTDGLLPSTGDVAIGANASEGKVEITDPKLDISAANKDQNIGALSGNGILRLGNTRRMTTTSIKEARYEGVIDGGANSNFNKDGTGGLTLAGTSTTTGTIDVSRGRMIIDGIGNTQTARTRVHPAGILKGTGRAGAVQNSGSVIPGKSIGTLTTGDYEESGTLQIEVSPIDSSVLAVVGNMTINPESTLLIAPDLGSYASTQTYDVVTVSGTGTGTYSTVSSTMPARFKPTAIYNGFALAGVGASDPFIQIVLDVIPFANIIKGGNAGAVAKCFDTLNVCTCSDASIVVAKLDALSNDSGKLREAFNQMQPSQFSAFALAQENNDILIRTTLTYRLDEVYPINCETEANSTDRPPGYYQGEQASAATAGKKNKGNVWFAPVGKYAHQDNQQHNPGYHQATGGALLGTDYEIFDNAYLGSALAYTFTDVDLKKSSGKADINSYYGTFYGNWFNNRVFIDAAFIGAYNHYHAKRSIEFIERSARNEHNGYQLAGALGTGLLFTPDHYLVQPYARADYVFLHQNGFKEHGASSLNLKVDDKNSQYVRTDLGIKVSYCYKGEKLKYIPYFKASWIWEKQIDKGDLEASFVDSSCEFRVTGLHPVRSLFAPSIGLTILAHQETFSFAVHYDAEVGHRFWENRASLNFGFRY